MKQAVILAGGQGTRLRERLGNLPKPMIPIANTPLLERQIQLLKKHNIQKILILVNYQAHIIRDYCEQHRNWGLTITLLDDGQALGTAGALLHAIDYLHDEFLVMYGDTMLDVDLNRFYQFHNQHDADATLFLHPNDHPFDSDLVEIDASSHIICFHPYPHNPKKYYFNLVNAALYWIKKESLLPWQTLKIPSDLAKDLFPLMTQSNQHLCGYKSPEYIKDAGTPERVDKITADFYSGKIANANLANLQSAVFIDRDGTINVEKHHLKCKEDFELLPGVGDAIRALNQSHYKTLLITNQPVVARGECSETELNDIHKKMDYLLGKHHAYFDNIYVCPHHPASGFAGERTDLKVPCNCRKPNTGMIEKAIEEMHISSASSWLIGDSTTDMQTAKRSGIRSIGVLTGFSCLDEKYPVAPDYEACDLPAAVNFILNDYPTLYKKIYPLSETIKAGEIVLISGLSRSGKSTFSNVLRDCLTASNKSCVVLSLDSWLKNKENRGESSVLDRYDISTITTLFSKLHNDRTMTFTVPFYKKLSQQCVDGEEINIQHETIIIIEGVVALLIEQLRNMAQHKIFIAIDESIRKSRLENEYVRRGKTAAEIKAIYEKRSVDETPLIVSSDQFANFTYTTSYT